MIVSFKIIYKNIPFIVINILLQFICDFQSSFYIEKHNLVIGQEIFLCLWLKVITYLEIIH